MINKSYRQKDEYELVKETLNGDRQSFEEIVRRYKSMVAGTIKGMLGNSGYAEDIGQEVFIKLFYSLPEFRGEAKLSTYIQRIAVNLTLNEIKRRKRIFSVFMDRSYDEMHEIVTDSVADEEKREAAEIVNKAMMKLEPKFRIVVIMRMIQGYSTKETAQILDIPQGTVLSRLARAQGQLRKILEKL